MRAVIRLAIGTRVRKPPTVERAAHVMEVARKAYGGEQYWLFWTLRHAREKAIRSAIAVIGLSLVAVATLAAFG